MTGPDRWHIYNVTLAEHQIDQCQKWLKEGPWYMHFWCGDRIIAIFKDKTFHFSRSDKSTWTPAITHGRSVGIPEAQLDFLTEEIK